jgi:2-alkenal reductase
VDLVPSATLTATGHGTGTSREIRLAAVPDGLPAPGDFELAEVPVPVPAADQVLVRNRFFRVSGSLRTMIGGGLDQMDGVPYPAVRPGQPLAEAAIGAVISAPPGTGLSPGDLVSHWSGWREYAALSPGQWTALDDRLPDPVAHLSHGWTAYAALTHGAGVQPGDTVLVSAAASAIGSMAGPLARLLGARRVIGTTSSRRKAGRLVAGLGYDAVITRDPADGPLAAQLDQAAPGGIDVFVDCVGGEQLTAAAGAARSGARFVLLGALSGQLAATGTGVTAPVTLDGMQFLLKKIVMRGFSADDWAGDWAGDADAGRGDGWLDRFGHWLRAGDLTFPHHRVRGLDQAPRALDELIRGEHVGAVVIEL